MPVIWLEYLTTIPPQFWWALAVVFAIGMICATIILCIGATIVGAAVRTLYTDLKSLLSNIKQRSIT